eukprot:262038_1
MSANEQDGAGGASLSADAEGKEDRHYVDIPPAPASPSVDASATDSKGLMSTLKILSSWQLVTVLLTSTVVFANWMGRCRNVSLPTSLSIPSYLTMAVVCSSIMLIKRGSITISIAWWQYFLVSLANVEANYLILKAYEYLAPAEATILSCMTVVFCALISWKVFKRPLVWQQWVAMVACFAGTGLIAFYVSGDGKYSCAAALKTSAAAVAPQSSPSGAGRKIIGCCMVIGSSLCYAISNITFEYVSKTYDSVEYLAMQGCWGVVIASVQSAILERDPISSLFSADTLPIWLAILGFTVGLVGFYATIPVVLQKSSVTVMNLSFLTMNLYVAVAEKVLFGIVFSWPRVLIILAMLVALGVFNVYEGKQPADKEASD